MLRRTCARGPLGSGDEAGVAVCVLRRDPEFPQQRVHAHQRRPLLRLLCMVAFKFGLVWFKPVFRKVSPSSRSSVSMRTSGTDAPPPVNVGFEVRFEMGFLFGDEGAAQRCISPLCLSKAAGR